MSYLRTARGAGFLAIACSILLVACGGSTSSGAPSIGPTVVASAPVAATPAPSTAEASGLPSLPIAIPSFDIGSLTQGLANVDSYKITISRNGQEQLKGTVVTKPELARDYTMADGSRVIVIGDKAWIARSGGAPQQVPGQMATGLFAAFDPTLLAGAFAGPQWAQSSLDQGKEQKNGVEATHYHIDSTTAASGFTGIPAGASVDLWIADEGILAALEAKGFPQGDFSIQVTDVDDPANKVEAPS